MTAFAMIRFADHILTVSDGAICNKDGVLAGLSSKIVTFPEHSAVMVLSGNSILAKYLYFRMSFAVTGFDELIKILPDLARHGMAQLPPELTLCDQTLIAIGGYSKTNERFETYRMSSYDVPSLGMRAWELSNAPVYSFFPDLNLETVKPFDIMPPNDGSYEVDDLSLVVRYICASRHEKTDSSTNMAQDRYWVGGFIEVVATMQDATSTKIIHRWPDRMNEPIDPVDGDAIPADFKDRPAFITPQPENHNA